MTALDDPWQVLGLPPGANGVWVRAKYEQLVVAHPPDRDPDGFARVHTAYLRTQGFDESGALVPPQPKLGRDGPYERMVAALDEGDYRALATELDRDDVRASLDDPEVRAAALRAAAVLSWRAPEEELRIRSLAVDAHLVGLGDLASACAYEAFFANRYRYFAGRDPSSPLLSLFGDTLLASPARRRAVALELTAVVDDARGLLETTDRIAIRDRPLAALLAARLQRESPAWSERALAPLPPEVRAELERRLARVRDPARTVRIALGAGGLAVSTAATFLVSPTIPFWIGWTAALVAPTPKRMYRHIVRRNLAAIFTELGVQADTSIAWARAAGEDGKHLMRFQHEVAGDVSLTLLGAIAAFVREHQRALVDGPAAIYR